jgi:hypothetical protein
LEVAGLGAAFPERGHACGNEWVGRNRAAFVWKRGGDGGLLRERGERYRSGERISTGFVESTVNQVISKRFCKKQQMQWTKRGAHLLLQTRVKTLNQELGAVFQRWYPDLRLEEEPQAA